MVIDRQMIEAAGVIELAEIFRLVPGFQVGHYHDYDGSRTVVTYHGLSDQYSRRMQVMIDGRSVYLPMIGGVNWNDLPVSINEIDRIEVTRGPNGAADGMNAFLGVIHIFTRHSSSEPGAEFSILHSDAGYRRSSGRYAAHHGALSYRLQLSGEASDGFDNSPPGLTNRPEQGELNDDFRTSRFNMRTDYQLGINDQLEFHLGGIKGPRQVGYSSNDPIISNRQHAQSYQLIRYRSLFSSSGEWGVSLSNSHHQQDYPTTDFYDFSGQLLEIPVDLSLSNHRQSLTLNYIDRWGEQLHYVVELEQRRDWVRGYDYVSSDAWIENRSRRLSLNLMWQPHERLTVNLGDMIENSDMVAQTHSPRVALTLDLPANHYLRLAQSSAYRAPTIMEESIDYGISHTLITQLLGIDKVPLFDSAGTIRPEQIKSLEVVVGAQVSHRLLYELRLFKDELTDLINFPDYDLPAPLDSISVQRAINGGNVEIKGAEIQLSWRPVKGQFYQISYAALQTRGWLANSINPQDNQITDQHDAAKYVPTDSWNLLIGYQLLPALNLGAAYSTISSQHYLAGDDTKGYKVADMTLNYQLGDKGAKGTITVRGRNLLGEYHDFEDETISKRNYSIEYTARF